MEQGAEANQVGLSGLSRTTRRVEQDVSEREHQPGEAERGSSGAAQARFPRAAGNAGKAARLSGVRLARDRNEVKNAGLISFHFRKEIHFEHPDDPAQHTLRLSRSDGVLLVWGPLERTGVHASSPKSCRPSGEAAEKGMCLFDPPETRPTRSRPFAMPSVSCTSANNSGRFDPARLQAFFRAAASAVRRSAVSFAAVVERLQKLENPYPGLRPFETEESHLFSDVIGKVAELVGRHGAESASWRCSASPEAASRRSCGRASSPRSSAAVSPKPVSAGASSSRVLPARRFESLARNLDEAGLDASGLSQTSHGLIEVARQLEADESLHRRHRPVRGAVSLQRVSLR